MSNRQANGGSRYLNFSHEEDSTLIDLVEQYRPLYDAQEKDHRDLSVRNHFWVGVAKKLGRSVSECKKRWRSMKDTYYRQKRTKHQSTWILMKRLKFLDNPEKIKNEGEATSDQNEDDGSTKETEMQFLDDEKLENIPSTSSALKTYHYLDEVFPYDPDSEPKPLQTEDVIKLIQQNNRERMGGDIEQDPICAFFHSMALTVKQLPPELIAEARVKICEIVGNLEIKAMSSSGNQHVYLSNTSVKVEDNMDEQL